MTEKTAWHNVDVSLFPPALAKAYEAVRATFEPQNNLKKVFMAEYAKWLESAQGVTVPSTHTLVVQYRRGTCSTGMVPKRAATKTGAKTIADGLKIA